MSNAATLRARARATLGNNIFRANWLYPLLVSMIVSAIMSFASGAIVLPLILTGPLAVGSAIYYLGITRRMTHAGDIGSMFKGFTVDLGGNIIMGLLMIVYIMLWSFLFVIPGIVKAYAYAMTPYIKADHPEYTARQAIDASRRMMNGHKLRLFGLHLSFIGWHIVGALTLGIGTLWVTAYQEAATAAFYEELSHPYLDEDPFDSAKYTVI